MTDKDLLYQSLLQSVPTLTEAIERGFGLGGLKPKEAAFKLGIDYSAYVRMFNANDPRHFPPDLIDRSMVISNNLFALDWQEHKRGRVAYPLNYMEILDEIRKAVSGQEARFALRDSNIRQFESLLIALEKLRS